MSTKTLNITIEIKKRKLLIVFDAMIADIISDKKLNSIVAELFIRGRKLQRTSANFFKSLIRY